MKERKLNIGDVVNHKKHGQITIISRGIYFDAYWATNGSERIFVKIDDILGVPQPKYKQTPPKPRIGKVKRYNAKMNKNDITALIDIALDTNDKAWFNELVAKLHATN